MFRKIVSLLCAVLMLTGIAAGALALEPAELVAVADPFYDDMNEAQLYELAKAEAGTIVIYTQTSLMGKAVENFLADYPEVKVEYYDLGSSEQYDKVKIEADSNNVNADIMLTDDGLGQIYAEMYADGYVEAYYPANVVSHMDQSVLTYGLAAYDALNIWFYNPDQYPDGCPITTWWDVLERDETGKQKYKIYMSNPSSGANVAVFANLCSYAKELEAAYQTKYGAPLEYTYDNKAVPVEEGNAAFEFLYRLAQMEIGFIKDGNDIVQAVGLATEPALGFCTANKLAVAADNGWPCAWVTQLDPYASMHNPKYMFLVKQTDNPAGARLLIHYLMGGDTGNNGAISAFSRLGTWFFRDDVVNDANPVQIEDIQTVPQNSEVIYDRKLDVQDFWVYWSDRFSK